MTHCCACVAVSFHFDSGLNPYSALAHTLDPDAGQLLLSNNLGLVSDLSFLAGELLHSTESYSLLEGCAAIVIRKICKLSSRFLSILTLSLASHEW